MDDAFEANYVTITDEDGVEFEMEILDEIELDGEIYYAMVDVEAKDDETEEVVILKVSVEDGEEMLVTPEDDDEAERAFEAFMNRLYEDEEEAADDEAEGE